MSSTPLTQYQIAHRSDSKSSESIHHQLTKFHFLTQDDCFKHTFRRSKLDSGIFERPERLRFVNLGFAAALAWDSIHNPNHPSALDLLRSSQPSLTQSYHPPQQSQPDSQSDHHQSLFSLLQTPLVTLSKSIRKLSHGDPAFARVHDQPNRATDHTFEPRPSNPSQPHLISSSDTTTDRFSAFRNSNDYLDQLIGLCRLASELNHLGLSEIPDHLPQGDLYISSGSEAAILGAIGTCYSTVDSILSAFDTSDQPLPSLPTLQNQNSDGQYTKAFANVRPPGHHCTNSEPMGFCWVNNVLISCMYSYLKYGIDRICILDIDLHHGNGSQEIVWRLNEQSQSIFQSSNLDSSYPPTHGISQFISSEHHKRTPLKISYSSLHDINSYPCEDGDPDRIKEASLNICVGNSINQFIQNLHIEDWTDERDFYQRLYPKTWNSFEKHMLEFFRITNASPDRSLIFVSAGFDACEYETDEMSRYGKKLPASFYHRFARDLSRFSDLHCRGRIVSILEGGYSEHTLTGSSLSYILGFMDTSTEYIDHNKYPWSLDRINSLLKLCKKPDLTRHSTNLRSSSTNNVRQEFHEEAEVDLEELKWISETRRIFEHIDSYAQVKSELNKSSRLEEKQAKLQYSMNQLALSSETVSPNGLRRSLRHGSGSKKLGPSPVQPLESPRLTWHFSTQSIKPTQASTSELNPDDPSTLKPCGSSPSDSVVKVEDDSKADSMPDQACDRSLVGMTDEKEDQSIDKLFKSLKLGASLPTGNDEDVGHHRSGELSIEATDPSLTTPTSPPESNHDPEHQRSSLSTTTLPPSTTNQRASQSTKLPRVKLVWKAGGIFAPTSSSSSVDHHADRPSPVNQDPPPDPNSNPDPSC